MSTTSQGHPIVGIDPSIRSCGIGIIRLDGDISSVLVECRDDGQDWHQRAYAMAEEVTRTVFIELYHNEEPIIVIETPDNWAAGRGLASKDRGDIQKLYFMVGALVVRLNGNRHHQIWSAHPAQWKGNISKEMMMPRCHEYMVEKGKEVPTRYSEDSMDALMLARKAEASFVTNPITGFIIHPDWTLLAGPGQVQVSAQVTSYF